MTALQNGSPTTGNGVDQDREREATVAAVASLPSRLAVAAGAWLLIAPFALSYSTTGVGFRAYWNDVLVGIAVIAVAAPQIAAPGRLPALPPAGALLGVWLAAAPFLLRYAPAGGAPHAATNDVLAGALLVLLALLGRSLGQRLPEPDASAPMPPDRGHGGLWG
jgi:hypothetical protein